MIVGPTEGGHGWCFCLKMLGVFPITFAEEQVRHEEHDANQEDQAGRKVANSKVRGGGNATPDGPVVTSPPAVAGCSS